MGYLRLLRQRHILVLWLAETLSVFGDRFFTLALMWTAWQREGAVTMGVVVIVESVPHLLVGAFGRRLLARFASFRALAGVDAAQILVVGAMPWLWDLVGLAGVLAVIVLIGLCDAITEPTRSAITPDLVEADQVRQVNGLMDLTGRFTWVLGPGSAAVLLAAMEPEKLFLVDAATFAVSALALLWLARHADQGAPTPAAGDLDEPDSAKAPVPRAWPLLRHHTALASAVALHGVGEFLYAITTVGIPVLLTARLQAEADAYAMVVMCMGIGSVIGNLLVGNIALPGRFLTVYCTAWALRGMVLVAFTFADALVTVLLLTGAASLTVPLGAVNLTTELSRLPQAERLRLMTVDSTGLHVASMAGMAVLPALVAAAPARAFLACGVLLVGTALTAPLIGRFVSLPPTAAPPSAASIPALGGPEDLARR
ncbi:MFS transporter [Streptomyces sp. NPDC053474]|uniref:MFS transporter n=1 Tax=Streptomyces sp. NPDC053474 TaxID=3365704 RepID=UPI0037CDB030